MNQSTFICRAVAVGPSGRHGGFALIEALIALLVVAFGMLAIGAFHFTLSRASDVAKQRTEATRIAQSEIASRAARITSAPPRARPAASRTAAAAWQ